LSATRDRVSHAALGPATPHPLLDAFCFCSIA